MSAKKCITCSNRFAINLRNLNDIGELTTYSYEKERGKRKNTISNNLYIIKESRIDYIIICQQL